MLLPHIVRGVCLPRISSVAVFHMWSLVIRQGHPETPSGESGITRLPVSSRLMAILASAGFKDMESSLEKAQGAALQLH